MITQAVDSKRGVAGSNPYNVNRMLKPGTGRGRDGGSFASVWCR
jgi:hypothetical protein